MQKAKGSGGLKIWSFAAQTQGRGGREGTVFLALPREALCEDRVLDGPASEEKGSKGGPHVLQFSHVNELSQIGSSAMAFRSFRFFELPT